MTTKTLTTDQEFAMKHVKDGKNMFITGPAGTGKTFLINQIKEWANSVNKNCAVTAMTGCAAKLIEGRTLHSFAGIGLGDQDIKELLKKVRYKRKSKLAWCSVEILIIDEVSMLTSELLEKLDHIAQKLRYSSKPFGGIQVILVGDFCQLPPVVQNKEEPYPFCFLSSLWSKIVEVNVVLNEIIRQTDPVFIEILNLIRMGEYSEETENILRKRCCKKKKSKSLEIEIEPTKLYSTRAAVDKINLKKLKKLGNEIKTYSILKNKSSGRSTQDLRIMEERLEKSCSAEEKLQICVGAQVILLTNLLQDSGLINGSRGVVTRFQEKTPYVLFKDGNEIPIEYHTWKREKGKKKEKIFASRSQIPLKLAWALTIHKSQGMSLDCVKLDLGSKIFEYGQFYTALARVRTLEGLYITDLDITKIKVHPEVKKFYLNL